MSRPCGCAGDRGRHRRGCPEWRQPAPWGSVKATRESAQEQRREAERQEFETVIPRIPPPGQQLLQPVRDEDVDFPEPPDVSPEQYGFNIAKRIKRERPPKKVYAPPRTSSIPTFRCASCGNRQINDGQRCKKCFGIKLERMNI